MSIVKLYETITENKTKSIQELSKSNAIDEMMGFSPVETVIRDVKGADDKIFRVGRLI